MITKQEREEFERELKEGKFEHHTVDIQQVAREIKSRSIAHDEAYTKVIDMAISPNHYKVGGIETIEFMKAKSTHEEFIGHLRLTAIKYLSRVGHKDDALQEYKKAQWYIDRLVEEIENA